MKKVMQTRHEEYVRSLLVNCGIGENRFSGYQLKKALDAPEVSISQVPVYIYRDGKLGEGFFKIPDHWFNHVKGKFFEVNENDNPNNGIVVNPSNDSVPDQEKVEEKKNTPETIKADEPTIPETRKIDFFGVNFKPEISPDFVPFGQFGNLDSIIASKQFFPVFLTGLSGNGKSFAVEQACAKYDRELIRLQINSMTDEDDLLGSYVIKDGNMVWEDGPVVVAMKRGAVCLLDELTAGHANKLFALQSILEGSGVYIKKINEKVVPTNGFNIIATANTKGQGNENMSKFVANNILDEAFLDRFPVTLEWSYPNIFEEQRILKTFASNKNIEATPQFIKNLSKWASSVRKSFELEALDEVISTRRLVDILKAFSIFGTEEQAIELCLARFNPDFKDAALKFYNSISGEEEKS